MSNAIAQSATKLAVRGQQPEVFDFKSACLRAANRQSKDNMKERLTLNRSKMLSAVCASFRDHNPQLFDKRNEKGELIDKSQRLPVEWFEKAEKAVDDFIMEQFNRVTVHNVINFTRRHVHVASKQIFVERLASTGENSLDWKTQHCACTIQRGVVTRRMQDAEKAGKLTDELMQNLTAQLNALAVTEANINAHMAELNKTPSEAKPV